MLHKLKLANVLLLFTICGISNCYCQDTYSYCTLKKTGLPGVCTSLTSCTSVLQDIKLGRRDYTLCDFKDRTLTVCCPEQRYPTTTAAPPPLLDDTSQDKSVTKCHEYAAAVYEKSYSIPLIVGSSPNDHLIDKCGHKTIPLIVGGELASPREFPHMALLGYGEAIANIKWGCGGTLISDRYILTAAHCINTRLGPPSYIRLGELNRNTEFDDDAEDFGVESTIVHPDYKRISKYNDIALIKLDRNVKINSYKRPACLPTKHDTNTTRVVATGWGKTEWAGTGSEHLQKVTLDKFTQEDCNARYGNFTLSLPKGIVYDTQICAGSKSEKKDTCQGDSGGPIQIYHPVEYCMYQIIGITSFGILCGTPGIPGVYTRVYPYVDWIQKIIWD